MIKVDKKIVILQEIVLTGALHQSDMTHKNKRLKLSKIKQLGA